MEPLTSNFYDSLGDGYDVMISQKRYEAEMPFFDKIFGKHKVKSVLDCACGTGWHVIKFSELGYEAVGCDISNEMIRKAQQNAASSGINANFAQADFKQLTDVFDRKFDCVICWGNSLNHELREKGMLRALKGMYNVLKDRGVVIIQIRNLPKLVRDKKRIFPMHYHREENGDRKLFIYVLDFYRTKVTFNVISVLEFGGKPEFEADSVDYRIVPAERLKELMSEAGFKELKIYGDFKFSKFRSDHSDEIVVIGAKRERS